MSSSFQLIWVFYFIFDREKNPTRNERTNKKNSYILHTHAYAQDETYQKPYSTETFLESARLQSERDEMNRKKNVNEKNIASSSSIT